MEDDKLEFLPPDYSEFPREEDEDLDDDELEDLDDDEEEDENEDLRIESLLDKQSKYNEDLARSESVELKQAEEREMSNTPFGSSDQPWRTGNNNNNNGAGEAAPWEKQTQQSTGFGSSWGSSGGSSWNNIGGSWGSSTNNQKPVVDY